jgi:hypothetical protein
MKVREVQLVIVLFDDARSHCEDVDWRDNVVCEHGPRERSRVDGKHSESKQIVVLRRARIALVAHHTPSRRILRLDAPRVALATAADAIHNIDWSRSGRLNGAVEDWGGTL